MDGNASGSEATRTFYDDVGWSREDGRTVDAQLFSFREDGPIRQAMYHEHVRRFREALAQAGDRLNLLECGCGGNPEGRLLDLCDHYTGVDFSRRGLEVAGQTLCAHDVKHQLHCADLCDLPFADGAFDAVYSAHVVYHIDTAVSQEAAIREMARVVRPGGVVVLIIANPWPLLFPGRLLRQSVRAMPVAGRLARRMRVNGPLPYLPMRLGWYRRLASTLGDVSIVGAGMASVWVNQRITEYRGVGRSLWRTMRSIDARWPRAAARLGNYAQLTIVRH